MTIFKKFSKNSIQTFNKMSVIINRTNAQGFWATIFWYEHVYFALLAIYQFRVLRIQKNSYRIMRFLPPNFLSIQHQWNNLKTGPGIQF